MIDTTQALERGPALRSGGWAVASRAAPVLGLLAAMVALRFWAAIHSDFETDEPYYWLWSRGLAFGYFDHPPMVAYFIRLGTLVFGDTILGIRSMTILAMLGASVLVYILALILFDDRRVALLSLLWFTVMPHTAFFSIITFPDTPAILFWMLSSVGLAMVWRSGRGEWWYLVGIATGLLLLSKYTGVFLVFGAGAWLLLSPEMRPWLRRYEPYVAALIALLLFFPDILWNAQHKWVSFIKQFGRALDVSPDGGLGNVGAFVGIQAAFVSPLIFAFIVAGLAVALTRGLRRQEANWLLLALTSAPILLYFLIHALSAEVLPQWPSAAYPAGIIAAVAAFAMPQSAPRHGAIVRYGFAAAPWLGLIMTLFMFAQMTVQPVPIAAARDPLSRFAGWADLSARVRAAATTHGADYIATSEAGMEGALSFYLRDITVFQASESIRYEALPPVDQNLLQRGMGLYVTLPDTDVAERLKKYYESIEPLAMIWRTRNGDPVEEYRVYRLTGYRGGLPF